MAIREAVDSAAEIIPLARTWISSALNAFFPTGDPLALLPAATEIALVGFSAGRHQPVERLLEMHSVSREVCTLLSLMEQALKTVKIR